MTIGQTSASSNGRQKGADGVIISSAFEPDRSQIVMSLIVVRRANFSLVLRDRATVLTYLLCETTEVVVRVL